MSLPLSNGVPRSLRVACRLHPDSRLISDMESGDVVCSDCGLVVGDRLIDASSEWRNFGEGPDQSRVGRPEDPYFENGTLTTLIGPPSGEKSGMSTYVKCTVEPAKDRSLRAAFRDMSDAADRIHLPGTVLETARGVYKEVHDRIKAVGNHKGALGIACLFIACRIEKITRTFFEVCQSAPYPKRQVAKCYKEISKLLNLREGTSDGDEYELVERFCAQLALPRTVIKVAAHVAKEAMEQDLFPSRGTDVVCSAAILVVALSTGHEKQLSDLVTVSGAKKHGIYQAFRIIASNADQLCPADFKPEIAWNELSKKVSV